MSGYRVSAPALALLLCLWVAISCPRSTHAAPTAPLAWLRDPAARPSAGAGPKQCGLRNVPEVPVNLPTWAVGTRAKVLKKKGVKDFANGAGFNMGNTYVLRDCSTENVEKVVGLTRPAWRRTGISTPKVDIYFDCGSGTHVIKLKKTLEVGSGSNRSYGDFNMIAPDANVVLDGQKTVRILRVHKFAHLSVAGLTFQNGARIVPGKSRKQANTGGANGAGILVSSGATLVALNCKFLNNMSRNFHARWGQGAGIKGEPKSAIHVWNSEFRGNVAGGGGAIGVSKARLLVVAHCLFEDNIADGGVDSSSTEKNENLGKNVLLVKGGSIRVDSVTGHPHGDEHVYVCSSVFKRSRLELSKASLNRFDGYASGAEDHVRASGAAIAAWNKKGTLLSDKGDVRFMTMTGCTFVDNSEDVHLNHGTKGWYVVDIKGAGNIDVDGTKFTDNKVNKAQLSLGNAAKYERKGESFKILLKQLNFEHTRGTKTIHFEEKNKCTVLDVKGLNPRRKGTCSGVVS